MTCENIVASNECEAIAIASVYHLINSKVGIVYMQNSGLGKTINPLTSLCDPDVYSNPVLLFSDKTKVINSYFFILQLIYLLSTL